MTHVRFRLNKLSGEVEEFLVDDQDRNLSEAEHDNIATEIARVLTRRPLIHEVLPGTPPAPETRREEQPGEREPDDEIIRSR
ncbi:MAG: hypothetical protein BECKG1743D_GA0114223_111742 [Candidatus Kentron sp. G]|nr:MAG: hypothetical protein BECKG1743E_GA0114224_103206 [Candidatus Kentron sp. G]VFN05391.1 MAG: hypothetical protein BECKG1743F_GA0114225_110681 [Candidatus Kentron sp. G]VFN07879.1 MAG: hypothetical protein BECKG1743D_GA0114223_111742 [Candidatus Kentron sp. G]